MAGLPAIGVSPTAGSCQALWEPLGARRSLREAVEADQDPATAEGPQPDVSGLSRAPALLIARGNVEVHAPRARPVEAESPVHLEEGIVGADEDRVVRGVLDVDLDRRPARVEDDGALCEQDLPRLHR